MSQFILDCFPGWVSQFGLLGCAVFSLWVILIAGWLRDLMRWAS